ncbi:MAG TPA: twin-arginine translocase subunit TatC [Steroidobacteraceae bacterium]|nr:twin-arginine translocase subunit TatC [Steroidobacteraceae bacterium]
MSSDPESLREGTLISHLLELRDRLMRAFLAVALVSIPCIWKSNELFEYLAKPLLAQMPKNASLIATSITAPFTTPIKLAIIVSILIAMPYVLYQAWAFVAPGLYRHEKRYAMPLLVSAIILFYCGCAFAYWVVFPLIFNFFVHTAPANVTLMADIDMYLDFVLVLMFSFGAAFEVPVAVVLLVSLGVVKIEKLTSIRGYVLIAVFVIAAILTPPDAVSQTIMAVPMYLLYEGGIIFARILLRGRKDGEDKKEGEAT